MSEIEEIKSHLSAADGDATTVSAHRWEAARLIYVLVERGETKRGIAEQIGKSHTHVNYSYRCWDMVGRKLRVSGPEDLPDFQSVYNSDEVRGRDPDRKDDKAVPESKTAGSTDTTEREPRETNPTSDREPADGDRPRGASGIVSQAHTSIREIHDNRSFWQLLSPDDRAALGQIRKMIDRILTP